MENESGDEEVKIMDTFKFCVKVFLGFALVALVGFIWRLIISINE